MVAAVTRIALDDLASLQAVGRTAPATRRRPADG